MKFKTTSNANTLAKKQLIIIIKLPFLLCEMFILSLMELTSCFAMRKTKQNTKLIHWNFDMHIFKQKQPQKTCFVKFKCARTIKMNWNPFNVCIKSSMHNLCLKSSMLKIHIWLVLFGDWETVLPFLSACSSLVGIYFGLKISRRGERLALTTKRAEATIFQPYI